MDTGTITAHKIHTRTVFDAEGNVLEDDYFFHNGPMALCEADPKGDPAGDPPNDPAGDPTGDPGNDNGAGKSIADMTQDQFMSWMGRINADQTSKQVAKQFDEKVMPFIEEMRASRKVTDNQQPNLDLQDLILSSDPKDHEKYFELMMNRTKQREASVSTAKHKELDKEFLKYSEDPLYRDIHSDMKEIALKELGEGWPPVAAAEHAKTAAEALYFKRQSSGDSELDMLSGSSPAPRKRKGSLPPKLKEACERDIRDGIVKDEADYIKNMSPKMREIYNV
jgi:hypothetical protein